MLKKIMEKECQKIPLMCKRSKCVFEETQCYSKLFWDTLQDDMEKCPKCCPKYGNR